MKKLILSLALALSLCASAQTTFRAPSRAKADTIVTDCHYDTDRGNFTIICNKKSGACYVWRKSAKTGKMYKSYMTSEISTAVAKRYGITYVPRKKK